MDGFGMNVSGVPKYDTYFAIRGTSCQRYKYCISRERKCDCTHRGEKKDARWRDHVFNFKVEFYSCTCT